MQTQGQGLTRAFQDYRRLTRVPRTGATRRMWLTARENRRSALGFLRQGLRTSLQFEQIMTQLAATDESLCIRLMLRRGQPHQSLATAMLNLLDVLGIYEVMWIAREKRCMPNGGSEYWYRLLPEGRAVMAYKMEG